MAWKWFSEKEVEGLNYDLVAMLDKARDIAGVPFIITSGFRSETVNDLVGGVDHSAHESGLAVDLACNNSSSRYKMLLALIQAGFNRIGIYDRHFHVDIDDTKESNVIWWGVSH